MRKLLLRCDLSLGDIVMLTAAVRDLHHCYPGKFLTDVRTAFPQLWENNPHINSLSDDDSTVERIDCLYPLINQCNDTPYHCLHGFIDFLNECLGLAIKPSRFKADVHISTLEKSWCSQVHELTGQDSPFWIVAAGGKYDVTIKWWESKRYQEVTDYFRGKIQFVQVGDLGHHHPKLNGTIDLRGKTNLRQLIRLVYHAQGVLCPVTGLMHLSAAIETKNGHPPNRPCVVVAGGREPAHWEAYPDHQFIHNTGALPCCLKGGCWKDRTIRLNDGDHRDRASHLCVDVVNGLPHCLDMITPKNVINRIKIYFDGGVVRYLNAEEQAAGIKGIAATAKNPFDDQPLNLQSAGMACDHFIQTIPPYPNRYNGRGIVICGGGAKYFTNAWVCINTLRRLGCSLPVELWHLGGQELDGKMESLLKPLGVGCVDASKLRKEFPVRRLGGWELKPYAILHSQFQDVLLLDADNLPVVNPEFLFDTPPFRDTGAIFWPDYAHKQDRQAMIWRSCGLRRPKEPEFESGQIVINKQLCWQALCLTQWFNSNSDFYYQYLHGDKETFHLAFRKLKKRYSLVKTPIHSLQATMCQHDFEGRRIFQHRNLDKWDYLLLNRRIKRFWFEKECRKYLVQLRELWDGGLGLHRKMNTLNHRTGQLSAAPFSISAVMISCPERSRLRKRTLENLQLTDWGDTPLHIEIDAGKGTDYSNRHLQCIRLALKKGLELGTDYVVLFEDDLDFNQHIKRNLSDWEPLATRRVTVAGLYNHQVRELAFDRTHNARIADPDSLFGTQAFIFSRAALTHLLRHWNNLDGGLEAKIWLLAKRLRSSIYYHAPSLVQHVGRASLRGTNFHQAADFDINWAAS